MLFNKDESYISFLEIPTEVSFTISLTGCPWKCKDCHSKHNWGSVGEELSEELLISLLKKNEGKITCVTFMGGDWDQEALLSYLKIVKINNLKTALYAGLSFDEISVDIKKNLDYLKTGLYFEELGGLQSLTTNQRFYKKENNVFQDYSYIFTNQGEQNGKIK